jgi:hypothetical protein
MRAALIISSSLIVATGAVAGCAKSENAKAIVQRHDQSVERASRDKVIAS